MNPIYPGRFTAQLDGPFVVFIIGVRVNRFWSIHKWLPVARAMGPMIKELLAHPDLGLLGAQTVFYRRGVGVVQYWRSYEALEEFSKNPKASHLEAWKRFNRVVGADGSVGIWHETYLVEAGQYESVYGNMPRFGLATAGAHQPAVGAKETASRRLGRSGEPTVPSYDNPK